MKSTVIFLVLMGSLNLFAYDIVQNSFASSYICDTKTGAFVLYLDTKSESLELSYFATKKVAEGFSNANISLKALEEELKSTINESRIKILKKKIENLKKLTLPTYIEKSLITELIGNPKIDGNNYIFDLAEGKGFHLQTDKVISRGGKTSIKLRFQENLEFIITTRNPSEFSLVRLLCRDALNFPSSANQIVNSDETSISENVTAESLEYIVKKLTGALPVKIDGLNFYSKVRYAEYNSLAKLPLINYMSTNTLSNGIIVAQKYILKYLEDNGLSSQLNIENDNIIITIPGQVETKLVLGAHYDSFWGSPGANDNGSGVAILMEIARLMAGEQPYHTLQILLFGRHEYYPMSSFDFVKSLSSKELSNILAFVTLDIVAELKSTVQSKPLLLINCIKGQENLLFPAILRSNISAGLKDFHEPIGCGDRNASDHGIFFRNGVPAFFLTAEHRDHYHSKSDTYEKLNYKLLRELTSDLLKSVKLFLK